MADQSTNLDLLAASSASKEALANALFDAMSPASAWGRRMSTTTSLTWGYYGGMIDNGGSPTGHTRIANGTLLLTASATNYVELNPATGAVSKNTTGFTGGRCPLYKVFTNASGVTNYEDWRMIALVMA